MTLIEMQNRSAPVVAESPTVLYELTARKLYTYYKADIHAYVMVMQNINRELCRRLRRAANAFPGWEVVSPGGWRKFSGILWVEKKLRPEKFGLTHRSNQQLSWIFPAVFDVSSFLTRLSSVGGNCG